MCSMTSSQHIVEDTEAGGQFEIVAFDESGVPAPGRRPFWMGHHVDTGYRGTRVGQFPGQHAATTPDISTSNRP
jgi:hypothetical protein